MYGPREDYILSIDSNPGLLEKRLVDIMMGNHHPYDHYDIRGTLNNLKIHASPSFTRIFNTNISLWDLKSDECTLRLRRRPASNMKLTYYHPKHKLTFRFKVVQSRDMDRFGNLHLNQVIREMTREEYYQGCYANNIHNDNREFFQTTVVPVPVAVDLPPSITKMSIADLLNEVMLRYKADNPNWAQDLLKKSTSDVAEVVKLFG